MRFRPSRRRPRLVGVGLLLAGCFFGAGARGVHAGGGPTAEARALIDRMTAALGGGQAIAGLRSLAVEAVCTGPGGDFETRVHSLRPDAVYFRQQAGEHTTEIWSTAEATWQRKASGEIERLGAGPRSFLRDHEFHLLVLDLADRFSDHRRGESDRVEGRDCRRVEMPDPEGRPASVCIAENGGLPLELVINPEGAEGALVIRFDDWREIDGALFFHSFVLEEGADRVFTYRYESIRPNTVTALDFVTPAPPGLDAEQEALVEILRRDRKAHLATDAAVLTASLADTLVEVSGGEVRARARSDLETFFRSYFAGASYPMWEDARPPTIRLSADAGMAWVARTVRVHRREPGAGGATVDRRFTSAYTATYEKREGEWKMTSVTSTFAAPDADPASG